VRSRLLLLIIIPTLTALVLAGFRIYSSAQSAFAYQRVETLAKLGQEVISLSRNLGYERDQTVFYIAMGTAGGRADGPPGRALQLGVVERAFSSTDQTVGQFRSLAGQVGGSYSAQTQQAVAAARTALDGLPSLRTVSTESQLPALVVVQKYTQLIDEVLALNDQIAQGAGDPTLAQTVGVLSLVSAMKEEASEQRAILAGALLQGSFGAGQLAALQAAQSAQQSNLAAFDVSADVGQRRLWDTSVNQSFVYLTNSEELQALSLANGGTSSLRGDPTSAVDWFGAMSNTIDFQMGSVEQHLAAAVTSRAATLRTNAIASAWIVGAIVILILALALLATVAVARSMVRPLRKLQAGALDVAGSRLPETVRRLSEGETADLSPQVEPIDVDSRDEIGAVARAFDQVHKEAVRLAANEAALRGNVNAMFVNLSRRSQSLVERQIHLIDDLEQGEQDSDRLGSLFRLDHLATRMRRNSENLLVLAGHEAARRRTQPVALVDVLRAAVSEIEHYERVALNVQPGIAIRGQVVNDAVHLLAELIENATGFSPVQNQVNVSGHLLNSGGVLLDITDQGVGMAADEMAQANWRLDNPPVVDVSVSRRMGLFVVSRLASRHGIRVRLRPAPAGGLTALIWLPDETVTHDDSDEPTGLRRFEVGTPATTSPVFGLEQLTRDGSDDRAAAQAAAAAAWAPRFTAPDPVAGDTDHPVPAQSAGSDGPLDDRNDWAPPRRVRKHLPEPGDELPARGDSPLSARRNGDLPVPDDGEPFAGRESGSLADRDSKPERVFGTPIASVTNGAAQASTDTVGDVPGDEPEPALGLAGWVDPAATASDAVTGDVSILSAQAAEDNRLPIYESVESDWFRRGGRRVGDGVTGEPVEAITDGWASPADEGWRAAEVAEAPISGGLTSAGLPRRIPRANLVPGGVAEPDRAQPSTARSAAATRERMASFQRGSLRGRAALSGEDASGGEDEDAL
jgi:signal transduction histidine kinase